MNKKIVRGDPEFQMFQDFWKLYQDFYVPEEKDRYWEDLVVACNEFYNKYPCQFAADILKAYMDSRAEKFNIA